MEFFEIQRKAKRRSAMLAVLFAFSCVAYIFFTYILLQVAWRITLALSQARLHKEGSAGLGAIEVEWFNPVLFQFVAAGTIVFLLVAAVLKFNQFRDGSHRYATLYLGARPVRRGANKEQQGSDSFGEQQFLNIVEEMAIASGISMPGAYILEHQSGINGFAFATDLNDAALVVTKGAIDLLDRDELQGLVAHEFSHLVSGDTRLNCVMLAILNGYIMLWELQLKLRDEYNRWLYYLFVPGLTAASFGLPLADLVKCAISRTREFRADAFAVQATRNPEGLAGALKKIGGWHVGSRMKKYWSEELSHFYFANGVNRSEFGLLSTHPPLADRIRKLDPGFHENFPRVVRTLDNPDGRTDSATTVISSGPNSSLKPVEMFGLSPAAVGLSIGALNFDSVNYAASIRQHLSSDLLNAYINVAKAPAVLYAIIFLELVETGEKEQVELPDFLEGEVKEVFISSYQEIRKFPHSLRLPLIDLVAATLSNISNEEYQKFRRNCRGLMTDSSKENFLAWIVELVVEKRVGKVYRELEPLEKETKAIENQEESLAELLSCLARFSHSEEEGSRRAFEHGAESVDLSLHYEAGGRTVTELRSSLLHLSDVSFVYKEIVLKACLGVISEDGEINENELMVFRAICEFLDVPVSLLPPEISEGAYVREDLLQ